MAAYTVTVVKVGSQFTGGAFAVYVRNQLGKLVSSCTGCKTYSRAQQVAADYRASFGCVAALGVA